MQFRIADTFTDSLARLTGQEQKAVKTTAFDLQLDPANPGLRFHKLDRAKDPRFWSVRVSKDLRIIVHRTDASLLLCYVGHHDDAYQWAERRKLEIHPTTGAAQLVEIRETIKEIVVPRYVAQEREAVTKPLLFEGIGKDEVLSWGVPAEWVEDVLQATEDTVLDLADHLPHEAAEAIIEMATGGQPRVEVPVAPSIDPFDHPDAQRRFRVMNNAEELERALAYPWEKWTIFLHPEQRQLVESQFSGPARVSGSAGTGKTIVALHRAVFLARRYPEARILLTTFSEALANALKIKLVRLIQNEPRLAERIEIYAIDAIGVRLYELHFGRFKVASPDVIRACIEESSNETEGHRFSRHFLASEWCQIVDAWQLDTWEAYREVPRLGRKTRLPEKQRAILWRIFESVRKSLKARGMITRSQMFSRLADHFQKVAQKPFDFIVVDEAQDIGVAQLRFLAALAVDKPNGLFFAGDLGQRIFQQPFSWKALGVEIRGRSRTLRINYRTSHQIRMQADRLLDPELSDVDGNIERRAGTISVFNGPKPKILALESVEAEIEAAARWLAQHLSEGVLPHEFGIFVRSEAQIERASKAAESAGLPYRVLDARMETAFGNAAIGTMHLAKGLEFRAVVVMACDDEVIPSQERIETVTDDSDLEEVYNTERHLLYVACTRARDYLMVTGALPVSEFIDDLTLDSKAPCCLAEIKTPVVD